MLFRLFLLGGTVFAQSYPISVGPYSSILNQLRQGFPTINSINGNPNDQSHRTRSFREGYRSTSGGSSNVSEQRQYCYDIYNTCGEQASKLYPYDGQIIDPRNPPPSYQAQQYCRYLNLKCLGQKNLTLPIEDLNMMQKLDKIWEKETKKIRLKELKRQRDGLNLLIDLLEQEIAR